MRRMPISPFHCSLTTGIGSVAITTKVAKYCSFIITPPHPHPRPPGRCQEYLSNFNGEKKKVIFISMCLYVFFLNHVWRENADVCVWRVSERGYGSLTPERRDVMWQYRLGTNQTSANSSPRPPPPAPQGELPIRLHKREVHLASVELLLTCLWFPERTAQLDYPVFSREDPTRLFINTETAVLRLILWIDCLGF